MSDSSEEEFKNKEEFEQLVEAKFDTYIDNLSKSWVQEISVSNWSKRSLKLLIEFSSASLIYSQRLLLNCIESTGIDYYWDTLGDEEKSTLIDKLYAVCFTTLLLETFIVTSDKHKLVNFEDANLSHKWWDDDVEKLIQATCDTSKMPFNLDNVDVDPQMNELRTYYLNRLDNWKQGIVFSLRLRKALGAQEFKDFEWTEDFNFGGDGELSTRYGLSTPAPWVTHLFQGLIAEGVKEIVERDKEPLSSSYSHLLIDSGLKPKDVYTDQAAKEHDLDPDFNIFSFFYNYRYLAVGIIAIYLLRECS
jgi:hypothetical protein